MADDSKPVYLRLRDIIAASILDGSYSDGDMLPSVRALAAKEGANPLTVAKAYQSFQDDGLVLVKRGVGMFVAEGATRRLREAERRRFLDTVWPPVAEQIKRLGISAEDLDLRRV
ncbi:MULTISPECIES: GntR family transcriptional regulator [Sphingobium]|jgi:GntR family transcriptional regulator|uniref:GntR family transcriptional regulator n=1 Tax=Sphingobium tyrosinilyticum TaxID=2715436 RepID=A0ABV9EZW6_9SPHN|nr:GntR family transcriptional regulator [Sphingobium sp. EP60837]ANI77026.1 putative HTH-type transcriptional regulator YhcF [Sphingobium sp. EP60837]